MRKIILLSVLVLFFISCKNETSNLSQDKNNHYKFNLTLKDSIKIAIDSSMSYRYISHQLIETDSITFLLVGDLNNNGFTVLDLDNKKTIKKIFFDATGPEGIGSSSAGRNFYYHNKDSIFIFNQRRNELYIFNDDGIISESINLSNLINFEIGEVVVENKFMPSFKNEILSFCVYPIIPPYKNSKKSTEPIYVALDLKSKNLKKGLLTYEMSHLKNRHPAYHFPSRVAFPERDVFIFPFEMNITVTNKDNFEIVNYSFNSQYAKELTPMLDGFDKMKEYDVESTLNYALYFQTDNNLFYLIIDLGIPFIDPNTGKQNQYEQKPFVVLVFDENFNKLKEQKFEGSKYLIQNTFVGPKGLYLSKNNPLNPNFDENFYKYDIFALEGN
ncbi:MAG: hypothetical protein CVU03_11450 [Bacteroidetes bacterium HGW-Bacteroidetes-2]|jgi:hypothetical protein|nr:MAG: hypothetical protein CVU03_11450 [Bacteroidetes bacterium HGW-Bacteroidetes-2]